MRFERRTARFQYSAVSKTSVVIVTADEPNCGPDDARPSPFAPSPAQCLALAAADRDRTHSHTCASAGGYEAPQKNTFRVNRRRHPSHTDASLLGAAFTVTSASLSHYPPRPAGTAN